MRMFKAPEWGLVAGIAVVLTAIYFLDRDRAFFREVNIRPLLHRVALFGVLAIGAAVVIIAGGIDLSTGAVVALSSVVSAKLLTEWIHKGGPSASASIGGPCNARDRADAAVGPNDRFGSRAA